MNDLEQISDDDIRVQIANLHQEKNRRTRLIELEQKKIVVAKNKAIFALKDQLLEVIEHNRTSCADDNIANGKYSHSSGGHRCIRCALLEIDEHDLGDVSLDLSLTINYDGNKK